MLTLALALAAIILLLTGCASPCGPFVTLRKPASLAALILAGPISEAGVACRWDY